MKRKWRPNKRFFLLVFAALFVYVGITGLLQLQEYNAIKAETAEKQQQIDEAKLTIEGLKNTIEYANTPEYIEALAREKLGWVKKGETRYVLDED
ncbi:MAG: septum formation initiator family protein [Clostridiales bacterium]|nr:septum formation initiator family protein [Clostridiales bacterium]